MHIAMLTGDKKLFDAIHAKHIDLLAKDNVRGFTSMQLRCRLPVAKGSSLAPL